MPANGVSNATKSVQQFSHTSANVGASNFIGVIVKCWAAILFLVRILYCTIACDLKRYC